MDATIRDPIISKAIPKRTTGGALGPLPRGPYPRYDVLDFPDFAPYNWWPIDGRPLADAPQIPLGSRDAAESAPAARRVRDDLGFLSPAAAGAAARVRALRRGREPAEQEPLRGGAHRLPKGRRAAPAVELRAPRPLPDGRGALSRRTVRQGHQGVRGLHVLLSAPRDLRPGPVPAGHELLRPDEAGGAGPGDHPQGDGGLPVLVREYPESRYAADALAKIDICRGRLAQKELWVAAYYINQGNPVRGAAAAREGDQGVSAHARDPGGAVPAGRGLPGRRPHRGSPARCSARWPRSTRTPIGASARRSGSQTATR